MSFGLLSAFSGSIPISGNLSVTVSQNVDITGAYLTATGGSITYYGNQKIHTFFGSGAFQVLSVGSDPNDGSQVRYMVIGGGGGGGRDMGGGGGAGGYQAGTGFPVSVQTYTVTVGAGGGGATNVPVGSTGGNGATVAGANGSPSIFSSITCPGGGGGASRHDQSTALNFGASGGSGGGASGQYSNRGLAFGSQGYPGANSGGVWWPGGGGGAGGRGYNGAESNTSTRAPGDGSNAPGGSHGGIGVSNDILGAVYWWAGGGGGGGHSNYGGNGGSGGGGGGSPAYVQSGFGRAGGMSFTLASPGIEGWPYSPDSSASAFCNGGNGAQFSGGGGGGTVHAHGVTGATGGTGGSGIVVIRYKYKA